MGSQNIVNYFALLVAISLIAAPITMADWEEQAGFSIERIDEAETEADVPLFDYHALSEPAREAVRGAIQSSDGYYVVYGQEDWPEDFLYSDYQAPGEGLYIVVYEGESYELSTNAAGGLTPIYWVYELPFVIYGIVLGWVGTRRSSGEYPVSIPAVTGVIGLTFHLLGPELDFPVFSPLQFVGYGVIVTVSLLVGIFLSRSKFR